MIGNTVAAVPPFIEGWSIVDIQVQGWDGRAPHPRHQCRQAAQSQGASQEALAWEAGVARSYMVEIETGKTSTGLDVIDRLAAVLEVEPMELLGISTQAEPARTSGAGAAVRRIERKGTTSDSNRIALARDLESAQEARAISEVAPLRWRVVVEDFDYAPIRRRSSSLSFSNNRSASSRRRRMFSSRRSRSSFIRSRSARPVVGAAPVAGVEAGCSRASRQR